MEYKGKVYAKISGKYIECTETINDLEAKIEQFSIVRKDKNGKPIKEGQRFKFKFMRELHEHKELIGSFDWNDEELRYEIDIWNDDNYACLSYVGNGVMYDFELLT